jgi:two-component system, NarL family, invasion response regulator UvrY
MILKNVLLAEDHNVVMIGTIQMLNNIFPSVSNACATNFPEVLEMLSKQTYDLIILDINIPGGDKPTMIELIKKIQSDIRILIFSGYDESVYAYPYLDAGADGFLSKISTERDFKKAVDKVMNNQKYLSPKMQQQSIDRLLNKKKDVRTGLKVLSAREIEIVNRVVRGETTAEIGQQLSLQPSTVSTHKMRIFKKLNVINLVGLIEYVKNINNIE